MGGGFFKKLSRDLKEALPETKGFSEIDLRYTERFYRLFPKKIVPQVGEEILPQVGAKIFMVPWNHVKCILDKCGSNQGKALFYIEETIRNNWSRAVLLNFLGTGLYERKGKALTNFESTLSNIGGDLDRQMTKEPYKFDFLVLHEEYDEKELKSALIASIERFLLELGKGFAYMGREYRLDLAVIEPVKGMGKGKYRFI